MPIPQTIRRNPLDLQKNIAIGVSLPFNRPFNSTYTTKDQLKSNLLNLLLTSPGERVMNPAFGCGLKRFIFEDITSNSLDSLQENILESISLYIPDITVTTFNFNTDEDNNTITLNLEYVLNISNTPDQVTVQFQ